MLLNFSACKFNFKMFYVASGDSVGRAIKNRVVVYNLKQSSRHFRTPSLPSPHRRNAQDHGVHSIPRRPLSRGHPRPPPGQTASFSSSWILHCPTSLAVGTVLAKGSWKSLLDDFPDNIVLPQKKNKNEEKTFFLSLMLDAVATSCCWKP